VRGQSAKRSIVPLCNFGHGQLLLDLLTRLTARPADDEVALDRFLAAAAEPVGLIVWPVECPVNDLPRKLDFSSARTNTRTPPKADPT
jgi:hypothetical protein